MSAKLKYFALALFAVSCSPMQIDTAQRSPNYPIRARSEQTDIHEDWGSLTWLAGTKYGNADGIVLGRVTLKAGMSNPRHRHRRSEEVLYMLCGSCEHQIGDRTVVLNKGDVLRIPTGVPHAAKVLGDEPVQAVICYSSGDRQFVVVDGGVY